LDAAGADALEQCFHIFVAAHVLTGSTQGSAFFLSGLLVHGQGRILLELELLSHKCFLAFNNRDCARMQFLSVPFYLRHQMMPVLLPVHYANGIIGYHTPSKFISHALVWAPSPPQET
jgi:hypothetical protein